MSAYLKSDQSEIGVVPIGEFEWRVKRAREAMAKMKLNALLITDPFNFYYFSGHRVTLNKMRPWIMILPLDKDPVLIEYSLDQENTRIYGTPYPSWVSDRRYYVDVPFNVDAVKDWGISKALRDLGLTRGMIGTELGEHTRLNIPFNDFLKLRSDLSGTRFVDASILVWRCRMIKSPWEIDNLRKACEIGGKAWTGFFQTLKSGTTVREVNASLMKLYIEYGADVENPGSQTVKGARGPGGRLQKGDMLQVDGGSYYHGYKMDATRQVFLGEPPSDVAKDYEFIWNVCRKIIDEIRPGMPVSQTHRIYNEELKAAGKPQMDPVKRIGHGIGLEASEPPSLNQIDQTIFKEGISVTPEPRIVDSVGMILAEEHIAVTSTGCEVLSKSLKTEMTVVG